MAEIFDFPNGTQFSFDEKSSALTLTSLCGMTCGHNTREDDYSCSGLAVICVDQHRLEGAKLRYEIISRSGDRFHFAAADEKRTIRMECIWKFETGFDLISCNYKLYNTGDAPVVIRRAVPRWCFSPGDYRIFFQISRWGMENQLRSQLLCGADIHLHGRAARSTVGSTPFRIIRDEENKNAAAFHVLPRGNWTIDIHSDILSNEAPAAILEAGLSDTDLFLTLEPGKAVELPEIFIQDIAGKDIFNAGAFLHKYMVQKRLTEFSLHQPPVIYNSWLYRFTDFTREQLSRQLQAAKEVGCEVFVVDAGWFGYNNGWSDVGDWREKQGAPFFGNMKSFADEVRAAGLKFGFWLEPERFASGIPIRQEHPEWFPEHSTRIDLTQPEAAEFFRNTIIENVKKFGAEYLKIDFNASIGYDAYGTEQSCYCTILNDQIRLIRECLPGLVLENCGSGALRNDLVTAGLYDVSFVSDNANPVDTLKIRQGAFMRTLPGRTLNWLVMRSAPERRTPIHDGDQVLACAGGTWDEAALFDPEYLLVSGLLGVPGFSGDLAELSPEIKNRIKTCISYYKENRRFFIDSHVFLLTEPDLAVSDSEKYFVFQMQGDDTTDSLLFVFSNSMSRRAVRNFRLKNLDPAQEYRIEKLFDDQSELMIKSGAELMRYGLKTILVENMHLRHTAGLYKISGIR